MLLEQTTPMTKAEFATFALEYYGIKLDKTKSRSVMDEAFYSAKPDEMTALKPLPFVASIVPVLDGVSVPELVTPEPEVLEPVLEPVHEIEPVLEVLEPVLKPVETPVQAELETPVQAELETSVDLVLPENFIPAFQLGFKNGNVNYTVISYSVTDTMDKLLKGDLLLSSLDKKTRHQIDTIIWYVIKYGEVTVRETRNSLFIKYTKDTLKEVK